MSEAEDLRTLPERYVSFGDCRAYIADVEITLGIDQQKFHFRRIQWTCGFKVDVQATVPLKVVRNVLRSMHDAHHHPEADEAIPGGDTPPPRVQDAEPNRQGAGDDSDLHPIGSGGGSPLDFRRPDPSDTDRGA